MLFKDCKKRLFNTKHKRCKYKKPDIKHKKAGKTVSGILLTIKFH